MNARATTPSARIRTMEEFSVASGISRPTLSRFFNDPGRVRPTTRKKIEAAMDRLGYRPNLFAVNFNRRNTKIVGIIVPTLLDPFYAALVQRIEFQALEAGYWTVIQSSQGDPNREAEAVATLVSTKSAGAIVVPLGAATRKGLYRQMEKAMPLVFLDTRADFGRSICRNRQPLQHEPDGRLPSTLRHTAQFFRYACSQSERERASPSLRSLNARTRGPARNI